MRHFGDITKLSGYDLPVVDCITGGSPCQDLSTAGKQAGLDGERSGLFIEQIRIVKEMRERDRQNGRAGYLVRPRFMVWENVTGAFSSNKGKDFQTVLTEIVRIEEAESPAVPMPTSGKWSKSGCLYDEMGRWSIAWRVHDAQFWGVPQRRQRISLVADFGGLAAPEILFERKGLFRDSSESGKKGETIAGSSKNSITETSGAISFQERCGKPGGGKGILIQDEHTGALSTLNNQNVLTFCISSFESNSMKSNNPKSGIYETDTARTIDLNGGNPACNQGGTIILNDQGGSNMYCSENNDMFISNGNRVRRLTPLECERLQGFPDGWTDIGEWIDTKGKKHKCSDSARYKALGNSIATPFWFWLLRRISAQYERPATLGSLFDGIGGFPYCWEKCNGKGTALWASEIEEFPIAVTKKWFPQSEG